MNFSILHPHFCFLYSVFSFISLPEPFGSSSMQIYGFNYCQCIFCISRVPSNSTNWRSREETAQKLLPSLAVSSQISFCLPHRQWQMVASKCSHYRSAACLMGVVGVDASRFSLEWLCLDADQLIIRILKLKLVHPLQHSVRLLQHSVRLLQSATESACWFSAVHACAPNTHVWVDYVWATTKWLQWLALKAFFYFYQGYSVVYGVIMHGNVPKTIVASRCIDNYFRIEPLTTDSASWHLSARGGRVKRSCSEQAVEHLAFLLLSRRRWKRGSYGFVFSHQEKVTAAAGKHCVRAEAVHYQQQRRQFIIIYLKAAQSLLELTSQIRKSRIQPCCTLVLTVQESSWQKEEAALPIMFLSDQFPSPIKEPRGSRQQTYSHVRLI